MKNTIMVKDEAGKENVKNSLIQVMGKFTDEEIDHWWIEMLYDNWDDLFNPDYVLPPEKLAIQKKWEEESRNWIQ